MLRYVTLLYATLLYATLCYPMLCYATPRYATLRYARDDGDAAMLARLRYATLAMLAMLCALRSATLRYPTLCYATSMLGSHAMQCYALLCYSMLATPLYATLATLRCAFPPIPIARDAVPTPPPPIPSDTAPPTLLLTMRPHVPGGPTTQDLKAQIKPRGPKSRQLPA